MKAWLVQLFSSNSVVSAMRVMSLICVVSAVGLGWYGILENRDLVALSVLCGTFLTAAFTGKVAQKAQENKTSQTHAEQLGEPASDETSKSESVS